jgi:hypothetical protein
MKYDSRVKFDSELISDEGKWKTFYVESVH